MFDLIGRGVVRYKVWVIAFWLALTALVALLAPSLHEVSKTGDAVMLPADVDSLQAQQLLEKYFPDANRLSSVVIIFYRDSGLTTTDLAFAKQIDNWLRSGAAPKEVDQVTSALADPALAAVLVRPEAQLVRVSFNTPPATTSTSDAITSIRQELKQAPPGLSAHVTGSAAIYSDLKRIGVESVDKTTPLTIALVVIILLVVYRSPIAPVLPLLTIGCSFLVSRGLVAYLGTSVNVSSLTEQFLIALLFGAGTDYCLFLISRYGEELGRGLSKDEATVKTVTRVGEAITSSAATVIIAMAFMLFAQFGIFKNSGPFLAIGIGVTLLAGLTLTPALMALLGEFMFWPVHPSRHVERPSFWSFIANLVTRHPVVIMILSLVVLVPLAFGTLSLRRNFDYLANLPSDTDSVLGFRAMGKAFPGGEMLPLTIVVESNSDMSQKLDFIDRLSAEVARQDYVAGVRSATRPAGQPLPFQQLGPLLANPQGVALIQDPDQRQQATMAIQAIGAYLSKDRTATRLDVALKYEPYSNEAIAAVEKLRGFVGNAVVADGLPEATAHVAGISSVTLDVRDVTNRDMVVTTAAVLVGVFAVLTLLLRSLVAPIYLILTILLSYVTTLGVTTIIFQDFAGRVGVAWAVPTFTMIMLVALGEDYNIFLMSRVKEETQAGHSIDAVDAVARAIERTGGIITSCGIILAGTFGVMLVSGMAEVQESGFTIAFGILLDTFVVRTLLVPSIAVLLGEKNWWPRRLALVPRSARAREGLST